jgi:hypothetical protein
MQGYGVGFFKCIHVFVILLLMNVSVVGLPFENSSGVDVNFSER